ncbi:MAG: type II secretion system secretin GspD [Helicobacteraceae bacterium]|jgi:general secretion pathway protein D|nr:type II secretion system secretin GspD [Helicobacteraceae bacterium]
MRFARFFTLVLALAFACVFTPLAELRAEEDAIIIDGTNFGDQPKNSNPPRNLFAPPPNAPSVNPPPPKPVEIAPPVAPQSSQINANDPNANAPAQKNSSGKQQVEINFSDLPIEEFLRMTSKIMGKNLLLSQRIAGNVDFINGHAVYKEEILQLAQSVLAARGMTLVEEGSYYKIVRLSDAAQENIPVVSGVASGSLMVTQTIRIEEENVDIIVQKIRHLLSPAAKLVTMRESNSLVVSDYPQNINTMRRVIEELVDKRALSVDFIGLKHIKAATIVTSLQQIMRGVLNPRVIDNEVQILKDDASNAIVVTGRPHHIAMIRGIVDRLDVENNMAQPSAEVIFLQNSEAASLVKILNGIVDKTLATNIAPSAAITPSVKPTLTADEEMNVLIAVGMPEEIAIIRDLVRSLDVPRQQVFVQAAIVEVSDNLADQIGITYGVEGASVGGNGIYTLGAALTGSVPTGISSAILAQLQKTDANGNMRVESATALAVGVGLNLLTTKQAAQVLSEPSVLCVNNKESTIYVGETRSILTSESTTSAGIPTKNYTRQDIGLTLKVKPRLSTNDKVALTIEAQLEGIVGLDGSAQPTTTKRRVNTSAIVNDGEPVILGGLIKNEEIQTETRVPYISAIPLLGNLFRNTQDGVNKTSLVVIVTPYIVEKSEDLASLRARLSRLEAMRLQYAKEIIKRAEEESER